MYHKTYKLDLEKDGISNGRYFNGNLNYSSILGRFGYLKSVVQLGYFLFN